MKIKRLPEMDDNNGWLNILPPLPPPVSAMGEIQSDFAIVVAGFAGPAVARRLGEPLPDCNMVLLDAGRVGSNAAGRSSGSAIDQAHSIRAKDISAPLTRKGSNIPSTGLDSSTCAGRLDLIGFHAAGRDFIRRMEPGDPALRRVICSRPGLPEASRTHRDDTRSRRGDGHHCYGCGRTCPGWHLAALRIKRSVSALQVVRVATWHSGSWTDALARPKYVLRCHCSGEADGTFEELQIEEHV